MATKQKTQRKAGPPEGFRPIEAEQPEGALELDIGDSVIGVLKGRAKASKLNPDRRYRLIATEDGTFFLNGTAKIEQLGIMDFPPETRIWLERLPDVKIKGQPSPMKDYTCAVADGAASSRNGKDDLPF
jgi:hypothetical protein